MAPKPLDAEREDGRPHHGIGEAERGDAGDRRIALGQIGGGGEQHAQHRRKHQIARLADEARDDHQADNIAGQHGDQSA